MVGVSEVQYKLNGGDSHGSEVDFLRLATEALRTCCFCFYLHSLARYPMVCVSDQVHRCHCTRYFRVGVPGPITSPDSVMCVIAQVPGSFTFISWLVHLA